MTLEEERKLKLRLTQLEISNARLVMIVMGTAQITQQAQQSVLECEDCGADIAKAVACEKDDCCWGFPVEAPGDVQFEPVYE